MKILFVIVSVLLFQNAIAFSEEGPAAWIWSYECGTVLDAYDNSEEIGKKVFITAVKGNISAFNFEKAMSTRQDALIGEDVSDETIYYSLIKYCRDNPTSDTFYAAREIHSLLD